MTSIRGVSACHAGQDRPRCRAGPAPRRLSTSAPPSSRILARACTPTEVRIPGEEGEEVLLIRKRLLRAQVGPLLFWYGMNRCSMLDRPRAGCCPLAARGRVAAWPASAAGPVAHGQALEANALDMHHTHTHTPTHPHTHPHTHHHHHARHAPRQPGNANGATLVGPFDAARSPACRLEVVEETSKPAGWPASKTASARRSRRRGNANVGNDICMLSTLSLHVPPADSSHRTDRELSATHALMHLERVTGRGVPHGACSRRPHGPAEPRRHHSHKQAEAPLSR